MTTAITISAYSRLEFLQEVIESLSNCQNIDHYHVVVSVDQPDKRLNWKMMEFLYNMPIANKTICVNKKNMGCGPGIRLAIDRGFEFADKVIHLEDDVTIAHDGLNYFSSMLTKYQDDDIVRTVCGFSRDGITYDNLDQYELKNTWYPWGWATWKLKWQQLRPYCTDNSWDISVKRFLQAGKLLTAKPVVARTRHIGFTGQRINRRVWEKKFDCFDWIGQERYYLPKKEYDENKCNNTSETL